MNYSLGQCGKFSTTKQENIIVCVVEELQNYELPPGVDLHQLMFHPCHLISQSLNLK
jgi:hypothetical protein